MFLTQELWTRYLQLRNHHMFLYGEDTSLIDEFMKDSCRSNRAPTLSGNA